MTNFAVGQEMWFYDNYSQVRSRMVTIEKVGRKWITLSNHERICKETLVADHNGFRSAGKAYLCKADCEAEINIKKDWSSIRKYFDGQYSKPSGFTIEDIYAIQQIIDRVEGIV